MFKKSIITTGIVAAAALGLASPALADTGPSATTQASGAVGATLGFGVVPSNMTFPSVTAGGEPSYVSNTFTVVGNIGYVATVQDQSPTALGSMSDGGAGHYLPWDDLLFVPTEAPNNVQNDVWESVLDNPGPLAAPATGPITVNAINSASGANGPVIKIDGAAQGSGQNPGYENPPTSGTDTFTLNWAMQAPINQSRGTYSTTIVYSLTPAS